MKKLALVVLAGLLLSACSRPAPTNPPAPVSTPKAETTKAAAPVVVPTAQQSADYRPGEKHKEALRLIGTEEFPAAEVILRQVVTAEPKAAEAWNDLSLVQAKLGRFRDAAASAQKALTLKPGDPFVEYNLGVALLQTSEGWRDAKPHLEASAKAQADRPEPWFALGTWFKYAGDRAQAVAAFQKASAKYGPAFAALNTLESEIKKGSAILQVVDKFPDAPVQITWELLSGYIAQGNTRVIEQVMPIRLRQQGETYWAALVRDTSSTGPGLSVQFEDIDPMDKYLGGCGVPGAAPVTLQLIDQSVGQHLAITAGGKTNVCGLKDGMIELLFAATGPVSIAPAGLTSNGVLHQFVPEASAYVPASVANQAASLVTELRKAGYSVKTDTAVMASLDLKTAGGTGMAFAWGEGVAFKPDDGRPIAVHPFKDSRGVQSVMFAYPYKVGTVTVPNHTFLVIETHQPGGPNGGDVLVLEYNPTGPALKRIFSGSGDGAHFDATAVYTSVKIYQPQGGFKSYRTTYNWDETAYTFVKGTTVEVSNK